MISSDLRRSQVYVGNGNVDTYTFSFRIFDKTQLKLLVRGADEEDDTELDPAQYSVSLLDDAQQVGGSITLNTPLAEGAKLSILSDIPYTQLLNLRNQGSFNASDLNNAWDKNCALIQQVKDALNDAVCVSPNDGYTPAELKKKLLDAANEATVIAKGYAEDAKASAEEAKKAEQATGEYAEAAKIIVPMQDEIEAVAGGIDDVKAVSGGLDAVKTVAANVETVGTVADHIEAVAQAAKVTPHIDDVVSIKAHIDEVHRVGQDLVGLSVPYLDLGEVAEEADEVTKVTDGYIKKVAEHIDDCIHPVGDNLGTIETVAANVETVGTVAKHLDDCIHPVGSNIDAIEIVAGQLEPINAVAGLSHVDYEAIFLNGLPDEGETNGLSD